MVKTKNNALLERENPAETHPNKKARIDEDTRDEPGNNLTADDDIIKSAGSSKEASKQATEQGSEASQSLTSHTEGLPTTSKRGGGASQPTLAVKTVIPHPTKQLIEDHEVEEYEDTLKSQVSPSQRVLKLSEYTNPKANIYALGKLLPTMTWGPYRPVNDQSKVLCDPTMGEPLTIWAVGHIARMWFMRQGQLESQASITILPLSQALAKQSGQLLAKFSSPILSLNQQKIDIIRAMKWQNAKGVEGVSEPILFDAVYDAREEGSLKTYSHRPIWNLTDLKAGNLILLEMKMTRYSRKTEDNKWHSRAQYEMIAISLLHIADMPEDDDQGMHHIDGLTTHESEMKESPTLGTLLHGIKDITDNEQLSHWEICQELEMWNPSWYISLKPRPTSNIAALQLIEENLPPGTLQAPLELYPREQHITEWYYQIYYSGQQEDD
ncbi:hypothetical protein F4604DRAFT_1682328 [Suillus subluteus]|nr:hypothetical protein F4604DRAFT_1682328 [Suillus subluteus]